jgi:hypothetical protein
LPRIAVTLRIAYLIRNFEYEHLILRSPWIP